MKKRIDVFNIVNIIFLVLFSAICLFPILHVLARSMSSATAVISGRVVLWPIGFNLDNYIGILQQQNFLIAYRNTFLYTFVGTMMFLIITCLAAYPLSKMNLSFRKLFMFFFIITMFFNGGLIPNFILVSRLGIMDTIWALVLPIAFSQFYIILAIGSIQGIPDEMEEAAKMDGANPWQILILIIIPLIKPALATIAMFGALFHWNDWINPMLYIFTRSRVPLMSLMRNIIAGAELTPATLDIVGGDTNITGVSLRSAAIILTILPITFIYPFLQRFFVKGIVVGSIKG